MLPIFILWSFSHIQLLKIINNRGYEIYTTEKIQIGFMFVASKRTIVDELFFYLVFSGHKLLTWTTYSGICMRPTITNNLITFQSGSSITWSFYYSTMQILQILNGKSLWIYDCKISRKIIVQNSKMYTFLFHFQYVWFFVELATFSAKNEHKHMYIKYLCLISNSKFSSIFSFVYTF